MRSKLFAISIAVSVLALGCSDSGSSKSAKKSAAGPSLDAVSCGTLPNAKVKAGGELVDYAQLSDSGSDTSFDPAVVQTLDESQITSAVWDGLTDFDFSEKCSPVLKPQVAESFKPNADASVWTFKIRSDAKFSNGEKITPSTFKASWERAGSKDVASPYGYLIAYVEGGAELQDGSATALKGVKADDASSTLTVTLAAANADFASIVSHPFFGPVSKADRDRLGMTSPGWGDKGAMIGNGPFKIEKADETEVVLVPNTSWTGNVYGDKKVNLDKITIKTTVDVESAFQAFEAGDGQTATIPSGQFGPAMDKYKNTVKSPTMGAYYFDFGDSDPQLGGEKNVLLRQAISLAIDRDEINDKVYEGTRATPTGVTPPGIPGFKKGLCDYCALDVAKAKKLLKQWTDAGGTLTEPIKIDYNEGGSHGDVVQVIISNLKKNLGIDAVAAPVAENYFRDVAKEGGCHFCRSGWYADYPTYGNFMVDLFSKASIDGNN
ncbi:MAG: ABC transporter substrate-binding protein, partial [Acidimicrobiia bacterium]